MPRATVSDGPRLALPIVLVGPMGAGKSRVGQRLAASVGAPFVDTDLPLAVEDLIDGPVALGDAEVADVDIDTSRRSVARIVDEITERFRGGAR